MSPKRVVVIGPESTGKSTLSEALANELQTLWVPEYARAYLQERDNRYSEEDMLTMAQGQMQTEDIAAPDANKWLICDTDLNVIKVWAEHKYKRCASWILEEIDRVHASGLHITFVDASARMVAQARKKYSGQNEVAFTAQPIETVKLTAKYDVVMTPFFFDNFNDATAREIFEQLDHALANGGTWLYCDFVDTKPFWQRVVLRVMYLFFNLFCNIETSSLPNMEMCYRNAGYNAVQTKTFLKGFITATVYKRPVLE